MIVRTNNIYRIARELFMEELWYSDEKNAVLLKQAKHLFSDDLQLAEKIAKVPVDIAVQYFLMFIFYSRCGKLILELEQGEQSNYDHFCQLMRTPEVVQRFKSQKADSEFYARCHPTIEYLLRNITLENTAANRIVVDSFRERYGNQDFTSKELLQFAYFNLLLLFSKKSDREILKLVSKKLGIDTLDIYPKIFSKTIELGANDETRKSRLDMVHDAFLKQCIIPKGV